MCVDPVHCSSAWSCLSPTSEDKVMFLTHPYRCELPSVLCEVSLHDHAAAGEVHPQLAIYQQCLKRFGHRHRFMAFIDSDEVWRSNWPSTVMSAWPQLAFGRSAVLALRNV